MRLGVGDNSAWTTALASSTGITTGLLARFEFASGTVFCWTGPFTLQPGGSGDSLLDGNTFEPIAEGILIDAGSNQYNYTGSEALTLAMAIPSSPTTAMANSSHDPTEWQGRTCVIWRCVMTTLPTATTPAAFSYKRVRSGAMDLLDIAHDGKTHSFTLTVEAHASMISSATNSTYLDQKTRFDSSDTSQDFAINIANNPDAPTRGASGTVSGPYDTGGGGGGAPRLSKLISD